MHRDVLGIFSQREEMRIILKQEQQQQRSFHDYRPNHSAGTKATDYNTENVIVVVVVIGGGVYRDDFCRRCQKRRDRLSATSASR